MKVIFFNTYSIGTKLATTLSKKINMGTNYENLDVKYLNYIFFMFLTYVSNFMSIIYYL